MPSEVRRPSEIRLDRFVDNLDARLRAEAVKTRRIRLPARVNVMLRALKVRALAVLQGGALALTALAVIVAVGIVPAVRPNGAAVSTGPLAAPSLTPQSLAVMKGEIRAFAAPEAATQAQPSPGVLR